MMRKALLFGGLMLLAGCAKEWRQVGYPSSFHYVTKAELRTAMDRMAHSVTTLDRILRDSKTVTPEQHLEVVEALDNLRQNAFSLRGTDQKTNHKILDDNLDGFIQNVDAARRGATADPPNYFLAGSITGACLACHQAPPR